MSVTLQNALYAGTQVGGPSGTIYAIGIDGTVAVDWPDVPTFIGLGFQQTGASAAVVALSPIPVTSPPTYTLDDAVAKINDIIAALQS